MRVLRPVTEPESCIEEGSSGPLHMPRGAPVRTVHGLGPAYHSNAIVTVSMRVWRHSADARTHLFLRLGHALPLSSDTRSCLTRSEMLEITTGQTLLHEDEEGSHGSFHESLVLDCADLLFLKAGKLDSGLVRFLDLRDWVRFKP